MVLVKIITHARVLIGSTDQENKAIRFSPRQVGTTENHDRHVSLMSCSFGLSPSSFCDGELRMKEEGVGSLNIGPGKNLPHKRGGKPS